MKMTTTRTILTALTAAVALTCLLTSCNTAGKDVIVDIPDTLYNTEWLGATSTATWTLIFGTESQPEDCSFFLINKSGTESMVKYKYVYAKPVLRLTPAPGYENNSKGTAVISKGQSGIMLTLSLETYPDIAMYLQQ